jgi:hypothetical protein
MEVSLAYDLHLVRRLEDGKTCPITLDEWQAAVSVVPGIRVATGDVEVRNPSTGAVIRMPNMGGDAEIEVGGEWRRSLYWSRGKISMRAAAYETNTVRDVVQRLARELKASVAGDEGELYQ